MTWSSSEFRLGSSWGLEIDLLHESLTRRRFAHTSEWPEQHKDWLARSSSLVDHHDRRSSTTELKNLKAMFVVMIKILVIQSCYETAAKLQRKAWKIHEHFGALTGRDRHAWLLCDRVVSRDVEEVPLSRSLGTFRDDFSLALTFYVLTTVSCVRLCNDKVRTYLRVKALSQFYSLTAGSSWPPRTTLNSCVVFAKILDQRDVMVFYPNFLMEEFFYLLTQHFFHFCHFCAFLYFHSDSLDTFLYARFDHSEPRVLWMETKKSWIGTFPWSHDHDSCTMAFGNPLLYVWEKKKSKSLFLPELEPFQKFTIPLENLQFHWSMYPYERGSVSTVVCHLFVVRVPERSAVCSQALCVVSGEGSANFQRPSRSHFSLESRQQTILV